MGGIARGWDNMHKAKTSVGVLTGNWEVAREKIVECNGVEGGGDGGGEGAAKCVGESVFIKVYQASAALAYPPTRVLVKQLKSEHATTTSTTSSSSKSPPPPYKQVRADFFKEIQYLKEVSHANIVTIIGACTVDGPLCMIFEFPQYGTLKEHLEHARGTTPLSFTRLLQLSLDVTLGLVYLSEARVVHRDLVWA